VSTRRSQRRFVTVATLLLVASFATAQQGALVNWQLPANAYQEFRRTRRLEKPLEGRIDPETVAGLFGHELQGDGTFS
jgi:hypothetical protein